MQYFTWVSLALLWLLLIYLFVYIALVALCATQDSQGQILRRASSRLDLGLMYGTARAVTVCSHPWLSPQTPTPITVLQMQYMLALTCCMPTALICDKKLAICPLEVSIVVASSCRVCGRTSLA